MLKMVTEPKRNLTQANGCNGEDRELEDKWMIVGDNPALMTELVGGQLVVARDLVYNRRSSTSTFSIFFDF
jgi:hypothetical protein